MKITGRLRTASILLLAAVGPPAVVWTGAIVVQAFKAPPPPPARVQHFTDYFSQDAREQYPVLPEGVQRWQGTPGEGAPFFVSMRLANNQVTLLSSSRFVAFEAGSRKVVRDIGISENATFADLGATALASANEPNRVWIYSWDQGAFGLYDFAEGFTRVEGGRLGHSLKSLQWVDGQLFASGFFESELVRQYDRSDVLRPVQATQLVPPVPPAAGGAPEAKARTIEPRRTLGAPLFPGLVANFSKSLNLTYLRVPPSGNRMAVAYQWSDRIDIYDLARQQLERAIAGPRETKLDFAVATRDNTPIFTLTEETRYSYVDVVVTEDAILALYSGRELRKKGMSSSLGEELHVFTWDGRLAGIWRLQQPLQAIELDEATHTLYGLRWRPTAVVAIDVATVLDRAKQLAQSSGRPPAGARKVVQARAD